MLDWLPNPTHVPIYAGIEMGFFAEEGIQLNALKLIDSPSSLPYLLSGKADLALYYTPQFLRSGFNNLQMIGKLVDYPLQGFCYLQQSKITSICDFDQKILGGTPDGANAKILAKLQNDHHFRIAKYQTVSFDLISALILKEVDIISGVFCNIEPYKLNSIGYPATSLSWADLGCPKYPELIFLMRDESLKNTPDFCKKFQRALQKSIDYAMNHPTQAFALYLCALPEKNSINSAWEREAWQQTLTLLARNQVIDRSELRDLMAWMQSYGIECRTKVE